MTGVLSIGATWLLTWLGHATVACGMSLCAGRWLIRTARGRDLVWKVALVAPLVTSLVASVNPERLRGVQVVALAELARRHAPFALPPITVEVAVDAERTSAAYVHDPLSEWSNAAVLALFGGAGLLASAILVRRRRRCWRELAIREPADAAALGLHDSLRQCGTRRPVRLTASSVVGSAVAIGRSEVCIAPDVFQVLRPGERQVVLAHELAHLERRDPAWLALAEAVAAVLVLQPLVRRVARNFRRDAEFICDEAAVRHVGDALVFVRALATLATTHDPAPAISPAVGARSSALVQRAERLLSGTTAEHSWPRNLTAHCVGVVMVLVLLLMPVLRAGGKSGPVRPDAQVQGVQQDGAAMTMSVKLQAPSRPAARR